MSKSRCVSEPYGIATDVEGVREVLKKMNKDLGPVLVSIKPSFCNEGKSLGVEPGRPVTDGEIMDVLGSGQVSLFPIF